MTEEVKTIIVDCGSGITKVGFSGENAPRKLFPTIVGKPKKSVYVGNESIADAFSLDLDYPIQHGIVINWDNMETILRHAFFNELRAEPSEHPVFFTESSMNPLPNREKLAQIMFETFHVPSFYSSNQASLSFHSSSKKTHGIVIEIGYGLCQIVPIIENRPNVDAIVCNNLAGRDLTDRLQQLLYKRNTSFSNNFDRGIIRDIKEKLCYVSLDYEKDIQNVKSSSEYNASYKLEDGKEITIAEERFSCPELLFKPFINGFEFAGIDKSLFVSINKNKPDVIKKLYSNIIISGGTSMFNGLPERIEKEITKLAPPTMNVNVIANKERQYGAWIGASQVASLYNFFKMAITRKEYNDEGSIIVQRKCF